MTKFVEVTLGDVVWLCVRHNERIMKLYPSYVVGDCKRNGQKMSPARLASL